MFNPKLLKHIHFCHYNTLFSNIVHQLNRTRHIMLNSEYSRFPAVNFKYKQTHFFVCRWNCSWNSYWDFAGGSCSPFFLFLWWTSGCMHGSNCMHSQLKGTGWFLCVHKDTWLRGCISVPALLMQTTKRCFFVVVVFLCLPEYISV